MNFNIVRILDAESEYKQKQHNRNRYIEDNFHLAELFEGPLPNGLPVVSVSGLSTLRSPGKNFDISLGFVDSFS